MSDLDRIEKFRRDYRALVIAGAGNAQALERAGFTAISADRKSVRELSEDPHWAAIKDGGVEAAGAVDALLTDLGARSLFDPDEVEAAPPVVVDPPVTPPTEEPFDYEESSPFEEGGPYVDLPDLLGKWELLDHKVPIINGKSGELQPFETERWRGRRLLGNSARAPWGDHGPLWAYRGYNLSGLCEDLTIARIGDFHRGREGHPFYGNPMGDFTLRRFAAFQCGGNVQFASAYDRQSYNPSGETYIPKADWPTSANTFRVEGVTLRDLGLITSGAAVRASWPFCFYSPGHNLEGFGLRVYTESAPEFESKGRSYRSHGGVFIGHAKARAAETRKTERVSLHNCVVDVVAPDREEIRLRYVGEAVMEGWRVARRDLDGEFEPPVLSISNDSDRLVLRDWDLLMPLTVQIHRASAFYSAPIARLTWDGSGTFEIKPTDYK